MAENEEELKSLLSVKEESQKPGLKLNIQKNKIMASSAITSRQIEGGKVEAVTDFIFSGFKITVDSACSHEIKRHLLLGRKAMTNPDSVLKSRDISLLTMVGIVKDFSSSHVLMWELEHKEGWAPKNWCFQTLVLEKSLETPLDSREIKPVNPKGNQLWIFIGRTDAEVQYFGHLMGRADLLEKTLMLGKIEGKRSRGQQRMRW